MTRISWFEVIVFYVYRGQCVLIMSHAVDLKGFSKSELGNMLDTKPYKS